MARKKKSTSQERKQTEEREELLRKAEARLGPLLDDTQTLSTEEISRLIYELRTHQIELEIQNEELRTAQVELSKAHDRYVDLYDYAPAGYLTLDENGLILEANLTAAEMFDLGRRRLLNQPLSKFIADEAKNTYYRFFRQLRQTRSRQSSELMMRNHHGGMFFIRLDCWPHIDAEAAALRLRVSLTDITKLKDAEHHLREAREAAQTSLAQFRAVYEHADVGLVFSDAEGNLNNWNPAALAMVGFNTISEGTQHVNYFPLHFKLYLPNGRLVPFENWPIMRVLRGEEFSNCELHVQRTDAHLQRILSISGSCIRDKNGDIVQAMLTMRDLTAIRATEEALQKAKDAADQASTAKSRFLAAVSHDLRQPLQTVTLLSGVLSRTTSEPQTAKIIDELRAGLHSMKGILNTLLDLGRLEAGGITPHLVDIPVGRLLEKVANEYRNQARMKHLELRLVPVVATCHSDPAILEHIVRNLVSNSIKYTECGGILIGCRRRDRRLVIEVWDTGVGIPEDEQKMIFETFYQTGNPARQARGGMGVGLSIVKQWAQLLSYPLQVRSIPGKGSKFAVEVPLADSSDPSPGQENGTASPQD